MSGVKKQRKTFPLWSVEKVNVPCVHHFKVTLFFKLYLQRTKAVSLETETDILALSSVNGNQGYSARANLSETQVALVFVCLSPKNSIWNPQTSLPCGKSWIRNWPFGFYYICFEITFGRNRFSLRLVWTELLAASFIIFLTFIFLKVFTVNLIILYGSYRISLLMKYIFLCKDATLRANARSPENVHNVMQFN